MRLFVAAILLSPNVALACSMIPPTADLGLPGALAGPGAVFTSLGGALFGPGDVEVPVTHFTYTVEGAGEAALLVPAEPLAPGDYKLGACLDPACDLVLTTIEEEVGDPGTPPAAPEVTQRHNRIRQGCEPPRLPGTHVTFGSDALMVVVAEHPADTLDGARLVGLGHAQEGGEFTFQTWLEGDFFAAAVDAEGELSEWTAFTLNPGCSTTGTAPVWLGALLAALAMGRRTGRR